jgi:hypothetical protein
MVINWEVSRKKIRKIDPYLKIFLPFFVTIAPRKKINFCHIPRLNDITEESNLGR